MEAEDYDKIIAEIEKYYTDEDDPDQLMHWDIARFKERSQNGHAHKFRQVYIDGISLRGSGEGIWIPEEYFPLITDAEYIKIASACVLYIQLPYIIQKLRYQIFGVELKKQKYLQKYNGQLVRDPAPRGPSVGFKRLMQRQFREWGNAWDQEYVYGWSAGAGTVNDFFDVVAPKVVRDWVLPEFSTDPIALRDPGTMARDIAFALGFGKAMSKVFGLVAKLKIPLANLLERFGSKGGFVKWLRTDRAARRLIKEWEECLANPKKSPRACRRIENRLATHINNTARGSTRPKGPRSEWGRKDSDWRRRGGMPDKDMDYWKPKTLPKPPGSPGVPVPPEKGMPGVPQSLDEKAKSIRKTTREAVVGGGKSRE